MSTSPNDAPYYPTIDPATIRMLPVLRQQAESHGLQKYLQGAPWPPEALRVLSELLGGAGAVKLPGGQTIPGLEDLDDLEASSSEIDVERELAKTYQKLKRLSNDLGSDQTTEKVQVFRITTSLLTKLVELMEKASNINQYNEFRQAVMRLLNDVMTADQRNTFLARMSETFGIPQEEVKSIE